ncbi:hypothetical protein [Actinoplanes sp. NPDC049316]|uniref:hypothetical protein n=1 Tax=Actinoplanes sp. NPDC049316 TaxID=3154727 RepID=UPI00342FEFFE
MPEGAERHRRNQVEVGDRPGPDLTVDVALAAAAAAEGVVVFPGRPWYAGEPPAPHLRLTYAAAPPDLMDEAVRRLARALAGP